MIVKHLLFWKSFFGWACPSIYYTKENDFLDNVFPSHIYKLRNSPCFVHPTKNYFSQNLHHALGRCCWVNVSCSFCKASLVAANSSRMVASSLSRVLFLSSRAWTTAIDKAWTSCTRLTSTTSVMAWAVSIASAGIKYCCP